MELIVASSLKVHEHDSRVRFESASSSIWSRICLHFVPNYSYFELAGFISKWPIEKSHKRNVILLHTMHVYVRVDVYLHSFLTSALSAGEWSTSRPGRFTPRKDSE